MADTNRCIAIAVKLDILPGAQARVARRSGVFGLQPRARCIGNDRQLSGMNRSNQILVLLRGRMGAMRGVARPTDDEGFA